MLTKLNIETVLNVLNVRNNLALSISYFHNVQNIVNHKIDKSYLFLNYLSFSINLKLKLL